MAHQINEMIKLPMKDEEIVELYWRRDESAIRESDRKYRKYLFSIAYNIVHDKLDCEECLNDPDGEHGTRCKDVRNIAEGTYNDRFFKECP